MRTRVGVFIINDQAEMLLIHRWNGPREYFVVPGGGQDPGESNQETAIRETKEETNLDVTLTGEPSLEFTLQDDGFGKPQHNIYYRCRSYSGKPEFGLGGPEKELQSNTNRYQLEWVPLAKLDQLPLKPAELREHLPQLA